MISPAAPFTQGAAGGGGIPTASPEGPPICPHCGYDLKQDRPIERDGIRLHPATHSVWWQGVRMHLSPAQFTLLNSIVKGTPDVMSVGMLAERIGYEGDDPGNNVNVHIARIRRKLIGIPIKAIWRRGYAWRPQEVSCS